MIKKFPKDWIGKCTMHYAHAIEKHPHFVDMFANKNDLSDVSENLKIMRNELKNGARNHSVSTECVLICEILEIYDAYARKDNKQAIEECYDAIAVLMRTICVLEGMKELGKSKK